jgi:molecular chaperone GrpE (heat shock protein)
MNNPVIEAFLWGKAFAEVAREKLEESLTNVFSDLGKFDAETREKLREFAQEVKSRAEASKEENPPGSMIIPVESETVLDLQEVLDELRAEIARLKAELSNYRHQSQ